MVSFDLKHTFRNLSIYYQDKSDRFAKMRVKIGLLFLLSSRPHVSHLNTISSFFVWIRLNVWKNIHSYVLVKC